MALLGRFLLLVLLDSAFTTAAAADQDLSGVQRQNYFRACLTEAGVYLSATNGYRYECDESVLSAAEQTALAAIRQAKRQHGREAWPAAQANPSRRQCEAQEAAGLPAGRLGDGVRSELPVSGGPTADHYRKTPITRGLRTPFTRRAARPVRPAGENGEAIAPQALPRTLAEGTRRTAAPAPARLSDHRPPLSNAGTARTSVRASEAQQNYESCLAGHTWLCDRNRLTYEQRLAIAGAQAPRSPKGPAAPKFRAVSPKRGTPAPKGGNPTVRRPYFQLEDDPDTSNDESNDQPVGHFGTRTLSVCSISSGNCYTLDGDVSGISLERLYFPKGGWIDFFDCELDGDLNGECDDEGGRSWEIEGGF